MITGAETAHLGNRTPVIMLEGRLPVLETPAVQSLGLRDGQVVRPTVEVRDGQMQLMLQGFAMELPASLRAVAGARPWWRVQVDSRGQWTLQPLGSAPEDAPAQGTTELPGRLGQLALRPPTFSALSALMQPGVLKELFDAAPQPQVRGLIAQLMRQWPSVSQLTPESLRRMVRQGGWMQESHLARAETAGPDTKGLLRLLAREWTDAPEATRLLLQEAVDDIEGRQLQTVADQQAGRDLSMSLLLPFADAPPVTVRWSRPGRQREQGNAPWVIDLHTRSSEFGEVWMRTRLDRSRVDLTLWAERSQLATWARTAESALARWLDEAGLQLDSLQVIHGARPSAEPEAATPSAGRLVDVRA